MADFIDGKIKGTIAETIVEEMFQKLGFYVLKLGQEYTLNSLTQLNNFIKQCGGNFKLDNGADLIKDINYVKNLPDFFIVNSKGESIFLEVKFRKNAKFWLNDKRVFETFPTSTMIIINLSVTDDLLDEKSLEDEEDLKNTRFHIWVRDEDTEEDNVNVLVMPFKLWLKKEFNIMDDELLEKYEKIVEKWFPKEGDELEAEVKKGDKA